MSFICYEDHEMVKSLVKTCIFSTDRNYNRSLYNFYTFNHVSMSLFYLSQNIFYLLYFCTSWDRS